MGVIRHHRTIAKAVQDSQHESWISLIWNDKPFNKNFRSKHNDLNMLATFLKLVLGKQFLASFLRFYKEHNLLPSTSENSRFYD